MRRAEIRDAVIGQQFYLCSWEFVCIYTHRSPPNLPFTLPRVGSNARRGRRRPCFGFCGKFLVLHTNSSSTPAETAKPGARTSSPVPRRKTLAPTSDATRRLLSAQPASAPFPRRQSPSDNAFTARITPATHGSSQGVRATCASCREERDRAKVDQNHRNRCGSAFFATMHACKVSKRGDQPNPVTACKRER